MINKIALHNFKCFKDIEIPLNALNVYSGINGMGKSTTIQAILLLKQSLQQEYLPNRVVLNGDYINIGTGKDLLYENANNEFISILLSEGDNEYEACIQYDSKSDVLVMQKYNSQITDLLDVPFEYLNAERFSPQVIYPKSSYFVDFKSQIGIHGEYTVHYIAKHQDDDTPWISYGDKKTSLKEAIQFWLNEISPNIKLEAIDIENTDLTRLGYYYTDIAKSNIYRPTNVGFGISYILPVIVALLKAEPESIIIIENPEAHLHPSGQRKMGELIAKCASHNISIHIETHSDHILNGIRIATKNKYIPASKVNLMFFNKKVVNNEVSHIVEMPQINDNGKLDYWPLGFFDEWDKALDEIL